MGRPSRLSHRPGPRRLPRRLALGASALGCCAAFAQDNAQAPQVPLLTPTFSAEAAYVDTRGSPVYNGGEMITQVKPGVHLASRSGRVQGSLDYAANLLYRAGRPDTEGPDFQNELSAAFVAEAITNHAFIEARASISQQAISAFGTQSANQGLTDDANHTEVSNVTVSPSLRGSMGGLADYDVRATLGLTETRSDVASRSRNGGLAMTLRSPHSGALLGWALTASRDRIDYADQAPNDNARVNASLLVSPLPELTFSASGGREVNDDGRGPVQAVNTFGGGLTWTPSVRTTIDLGAERRYFGHSSHASFDYRRARSVWHYSYHRDNTSSASIGGVPFTLYDQFYDLTPHQLDPATRDQMARDAIRGFGGDPNQVIAGGFLTSSVSLQRRHDLSATWLGLRTTFTVQGFSTEVTGLNSAPTLDTGVGETVKQLGYSATLSYRVTPVASINLLGSMQKTLDTPAHAGNNLKSASISLSNQISARATTSIGARYTVFNSPTDPYRESVLNGSLSLRF